MTGLRRLMQHLVRRLRGEPDPRVRSYVVDILTSFAQSMSELYPNMVMERLVCVIDLLNKLQQFGMLSALKTTHRRMKVDAGTFDMWVSYGPLTIKADLYALARAEVLALDEPWSGAIEVYYEGWFIPSSVLCCSPWRAAVDVFIDDVQQAARDVRKRLSDEQARDLDALSSRVHRFVALTRPSEAGDQLSG